jgi:uncharacterized protein (DUF58 family)
MHADAPAAAPAWTPWTLLPLAPSRRAVALAAAGLPVALLPALAAPRLWPLWPAFLGALTLALAADVLLAPRRREVGVTVELPASIAIGEGGAAQLTVSAPRPLPVSVAVDLSEKLRPQPRLQGRATAAGGRLTCLLEPTRRGRVVVERAWVRYTGPLGLMARVAVVDLGRAATVVPDLRPVRAAALRFDAERNVPAGLQIERFTGDGSEFESLREYVRGDDPRVIDWKVSAHHRKLVVRHHRAERNHQVVLAVDTGRLMAEPLAGVPRQDHAVTAGLLLAYISLRAGDRVGLAGFDARLGPWLQPRAGWGAFAALQRHAGRLDYSTAETNFTLALTTLGARLTRRSLVVVLTDFVDTVTAELMTENLGRLARRHMVVFVALQDPGLAEVAAAPPAGILELNRAVVAAGLLRDREVVLRELVQRGIHAIDAPPRLLGTRLLNAYLDIKRRERVG